MEKFKEKLKMQNAVMTIGAAVLLLMTVIGFSGRLRPLHGAEHWIDAWNGFVTGASVGIEFMIVFCLIRNIQALTDEKLLKKLYIKENDERTEQIFVHARSVAMQTFLLLGLVAVVVAGYFSVVVRFTILACLLAESLMCLGFKVYYSKRY